MQKCLIVFGLLLVSFVAGCISNDSPKSKISSNETLLVITSYVDFPNNRLIVCRDGTYTWKNFDTDNLTWQKILSGNLEQSELTNIEKQLVKSSSGLRWTSRAKVKDKHGKEVELVIFKVVTENNHFVYNFSELDSSTMSPDAIKVVLDKCDYIKVLNMLGFAVD